jgi:hypothetical protein
MTIDPARLPMTEDEVAWSRNRFERVRQRICEAFGEVPVTGAMDNAARMMVSAFDELMSQEACRPSSSRSDEGPRHD